MKLIMWSVSAVLATICVAFAADSITVDSIANNVNTVVSTISALNLGTVSIVIVLAAIIKLIISVMKFKPVAKYLDTEKMKSLKPYIAMILGILGCVANNLITGQDIVVGVIAGIAAGLGSVGIHESVKTIQGKNK